MMGFKSWPFRRFLLPLPLAAWATFLALSMATLAPFILAVPATRRRRPGVGGGVGREALGSGVRSGRVVARAAPHRQAVQCRARRGAAGGGLCVAVRSACCCAAAVGCDFFNCWGFVL